MKLQFLRPMLYTALFDETIVFYTETLGFVLGNRNDDWGWARLYKDDVEIMLARPNEHFPFEKASFTGSFYFTTDDVETIWQQLKDKAKICYEIESFEWGMREFAVYDNNGYILQFGQSTE
ncbi:MAG: VOC family protein [Chitinophagaceae bacterium]